MIRTMLQGKLHRVKVAGGPALRKFPVPIDGDFASASGIPETKRFRYLERDQWKRFSQHYAIARLNAARDHLGERCGGAVLKLAT